MKVKYRPLNDAIQATKDAELVGLFRDRARRCLEYMDDMALAGASAKDLAITAAVMVDKARLLADQPTSITRIEDIRSLDELTEMVKDELARRQQVVDVTPEEPAQPSQGSQGQQTDGRQESA